MNSDQTLDPQSLPLEEQLLGINAKTAPYPAARSWSGGRRRIVGKGPLESYTYHVMSRTCKKDARQTVLALLAILINFYCHENCPNH